MALRRQLVLIVVLVAGLSVASCLDQQSLNRQSYGYFLRDEKTMEDMGLPTYWLGREFSAGDVAFNGPYVSGYGAEVQGGGVNMDYLGPADCDILKLEVFSEPAWEIVRERVTNPHPLPAEGKVARRTVAVSGREGQLMAVIGGTRPVDRLWLIVDLQSVVVMAEASSCLSPASEGASEASTFISNPDLLVQVMQDLRPYPQ